MIHLQIVLPGPSHVRLTKMLHIGCKRCGDAWGINTYV